MTHPMLVALAVPAILLAGGPAAAEERRADAPQKVAAADTTAAAAETPPFTPPPGFRERKRGEFVVYCRREEPKGTRFPQEVCYDEQALRDMAQSRREDQAAVGVCRDLIEHSTKCARVKSPAQAGRPAPPAAEPRLPRTV